MKASSINVLLVFALGVSLTACGGGGDGDDDHYNGNVTNSSTAPAVTAPDGARLLAAQCFQCHGTGGLSATGIDSLAGKRASSLINEMLEMKYSTKVRIMHYQAKGYSEDQIQAIATYLAALPRNGGGN